MPRKGSRKRRSSSGRAAGSKEIERATPVDGDEPQIASTSVIVQDGKPASDEAASTVEQQGAQKRSRRESGDAASTSTAAPACATATVADETDPDTPSSRMGGGKYISRMFFIPVAANNDRSSEDHFPAQGEGLEPGFVLPPQPCEQCIASHKICTIGNGKTIQGLNREVPDARCDYCTLLGEKCSLRRNVYRTDEEKYALNNVSWRMEAIVDAMLNGTRSKDVGIDELCRLDYEGNQCVADYAILRQP